MDNKTRRTMQLGNLIQVCDDNGIELTARQATQICRDTIDRLLDEIEDLEEKISDEFPTLRNKEL